MKDWSKPTAVSDVEASLGSWELDTLLPKSEEIPEDFKGFYGRAGAKKWVSTVEDLFFRGAKKIEITPKEGINPVTAMRHLKAILKSWKPEHNHKIAGTAYLMSLWFKDFKYEVECALDMGEKQ